LAGSGPLTRPPAKRSEKRDEPDILVGRRPVLEVLRAGPGVEKVFIAEGLAPSNVLGEIRKRAEKAAVPVRMVPKTELEKMARGSNHQGVAAFTARYRYRQMRDLLEIEKPCLLFLDGLTDPHNLGSLLRSADGAGFTGVVVPAHRSVGVTGAARRVSAGAAEIVPVARVTNLGNAIDEARRAGVWVLGLDEKADRDLWASELTEPPVGLVLGAEDRGISKGIRERCDEVLSIPLVGRIGSLNVAVAGAVAMFEVSRKRDLSG
jgi:23S rRNA (guanosine2251-2'-O)-methyltransferase